MKILKKIGWLLLIALIIAQFFGPDKNEGNLNSVEAFLNETNPNEEVKMVLKESCYDCHSSFTRYPWYSSITPVNYWMNDHIIHGKKHLDFSEWNNYSAKKKDHKLEEVIEFVEKKEMPLPSYTWTHREAKLSDAQIKAVVEWAENARLKYAFEKDPQ